MTSRLNLFLILGLVALASIAFSLLQGSDLISSYQLLKTVLHQGDDLSAEIVLFIRLPHALTAFVTGGLLALAGAMMQVLVRNPLADPYVLGISGGAAVMTLLCMLLGISGYWLTGGAWAGSLLAMLLVFLCTKKIAGQPQQLLLTGVALASGFSALSSLILSISPDHTLRGMLFWLVGDLSEAHLPVLEGCVLLIGLMMSLSFARELNLLVRGEKAAKALGVNTHRLQWKLYLLSSFLTATAVTLAGCIGFVGLIVPHMFRLLFGYDHRFLLPGCVLMGGSLLTIADMLSRRLFFPQQLPVGIVMVLIGIPIFIFLLQKKTA